MSRDSRGPFRTVESVESTPRAHLTRFVECGHVSSLTRHFAAPEPGEQVRCFSCGPHGEEPTFVESQAAAAKEFEQARESSPAAVSARDRDIEAREEFGGGRGW